MEGKFPPLSDKPKPKYARMVFSTRHRKIYQSILLYLSTILIHLYVSLVSYIVRTRPALPTAL